MGVGAALRLPETLGVLERVAELSWLADELLGRVGERDAEPVPLRVWLPVAVGVRPDVTVCEGDAEALGLCVPLSLAPWLDVAL